MPSPQVILKSEPVHPFGLAVYGEHIFWTDWVRRAVQRANKYVGSDMKLLRVDIPQQPMGIIAVANDTNSCECGCCHQPCCPAPHADMYIHTQVHTHTHTHTCIHTTLQQAPAPPLDTPAYAVITPPPRTTCIPGSQSPTCMHLRLGLPHPLCAPAQTHYHTGPG